MLKPERNPNPDFSNVPVNVKTATKNPANMKTIAKTKTDTLFPLLSILTGSRQDNTIHRKLKVFHSFFGYKFFTSQTFPC